MRDPDMGIVMFGPMLMRWGTDEQKKKYLPRIVDQKDIWCQGYSEPNAGSDLAGLQTSAVLEGDHYVINGSKIWTSSGHWADHMFFLARTDKNAKKQEGITFFVLDGHPKTPGFTVRPILNIANHEEFAQEYSRTSACRRRSGRRGQQGLDRGQEPARLRAAQFRQPASGPCAADGGREVAKAAGVWDDAEFQAQIRPGLSSTSRTSIRPISASPTS